MQLGEVLRVHVAKYGLQVPIKVVRHEEHVAYLVALGAQRDYIVEARREDVQLAF